MRRGKDRQRYKRFRLWTGRFPSRSAALGAALDSLEKNLLMPELVLALGIPIWIVATVGWSWIFSQHVVLSVGADGIAVRTKRNVTFVPWTDIEAAEIRERELPKSAPDQLRQILVVQGHDDDIAVAGTMGKLRLVEEAIELARSAHAGSTGVDAVALARAGRSAADWVTWLQSIASGASANYRTAPPSRETLWRVVQAPGVAGALRAAAAIALGPLDRRETKRLRHVAKVTACPGVREVFISCARPAPATRRQLTKLLEELEQGALLQPFDA